MKFTFDQLAAFIAVAEEEHFGRAADRLHLTQPPLSRQIQTLEKHLRVELFDRRGRRTRLTAAGAAFLVEARRLVSLASGAEDTVRRVAGGLSGRVHIGFTSVVGNAILPRLLPTTAKQLPDVQLTLHEVRTPNQAEALLSGRIDLALGRSFTLTDDLIARPLPPDELVLVMPESLVPAGEGARPETLAHLDGREFIMYAEDDPHHVHDVVTSVLTSNDVHPRYVQRAMEVYTMLSLVDAGVGAAIVPRSTLNWAGRNTRVVPVPELDGAYTHSVAVWRGEPMNPAVSQLLRVLEQAVVG
jgi:DNA-binding transcriptional LysR family regulator